MAFFSITLNQPRPCMKFIHHLEEESWTHQGALCISLPVASANTQGALVLCSFVCAFAVLLTRPIHRHTRLIKNRPSYF
uniref:Uncharacterized protein n=1 Tax=Parascaris equorum TaxID=6256 RepID=A0A914R8E8_PAREQ